MKKDILAFLVIASVIFLVLVFVVKYRKSTSNPPFLIPKIEALLNDKKILDSIGGMVHTEATFNAIDFNVNDTLRSSIKIIGRKKSLLYNAVHLRKPKGKNHWELLDEKLIIE